MLFSTVRGGRGLSWPVRRGAALYRFGHAAGLCFTSQQCGAFATARVARLVEQVRGLGIEGVVQTSWGPTVTALVRDEMAAASLIERLRSTGDVSDLDMLVA